MTAESPDHHLATPPRLMSEDADALYRRVVQRGGRWQPTDGADEPAAEELRRLGLLARDASGSQWIATDPQVTAAQLTLGLQAQAVNLLGHAARVPDVLRDLSDAYRQLEQTGPQSPGEATSTYVEGVENIRARLTQLAAGCAREAATMQATGPQPYLTRRGVRAVEGPLARSGIERRALYQSHARHDPGHRGVIKALIRAGCQVRILDEALPSVYVFDRTWVVICLPEDPPAALVTSDPATAAYVARVFDRDWARAAPYEEPVPEPGRLSAQQEAILRMLAGGDSQPQIAGKLNLSERTVAGHVGRIRAHYGVETIFQLALAVGREQGRRA
ncbi:helix-turn-helix transcriptional regulator [Streptacidiphilus griseoplanus]|uniref:helix-turn-helix transcriptional regulator n=1 Tax=Peterkaempfera griseoplana TaxID=66896 RepID=UPI0006E2B489|nr:helix-turn-helix transcriptional regulator [Peterkaempfera griseoplana]